MSESPTSPDSAAPAIVPLDMSAEGDGDLLAYMSMAGEFPAHGREAWAEFYRRHAAFLYLMWRNAVVGLSRPPILAEDLVADSFMRAFERAGAYCEPSGLDADGKRRNALAWLSQIAQILIR